MKFKSGVVRGVVWGKFGVLLRLTKEQSALLENIFRERSTLNSTSKSKESQFNFSGLLLK